MDQISFAETRPKTTRYVGVFSSSVDKSDEKKKKTTRYVLFLGVRRRFCRRRGFSKTFPRRFGGQSDVKNFLVGKSDERLLRSDWTNHEFEVTPNSIFNIDCHFLIMDSI